MAPIKQSKLKLKESVIEFYKLYSKNGHGFTYNQWKRCDLSKITIYRLLEKFDKEGTIAIRMFENLKVRILITKENGLIRF